MPSTPSIISVAKLLELSDELDEKIALDNNVTPSFTKDKVEVSKDPITTDMIQDAKNLREVVDILNNTASPSTEEEKAVLTATLNYKVNELIAGDIGNIVQDKLADIITEEVGKLDLSKPSTATVKEVGEIGDPTPDETLAKNIAKSLVNAMIDTVADEVEATFKVSPNSNTDESSMYTGSPEVKSEDSSMFSEEPTVVADETSMYSEFPEVKSESSSMYAESPEVKADETSMFSEDPVVTPDDAGTISSESLNSDVDPTSMYSDSPNEDTDASGNMSDVSYMESLDQTEPMSADSLDSSTDSVSGMSSLTSEPSEQVTFPDTSVSSGEDSSVINLFQLSTDPEVQELVNSVSIASSFSIISNQIAAQASTILPSAFEAVVGYGFSVATSILDSVSFGIASEVLDFLKNPADIIAGKVSAIMNSLSTTDSIIAVTLIPVMWLESIQRNTMGVEAFNAAGGWGQLDTLSNAVSDLLSSVLGKTSDSTSIEPNLNLSSNTSIAYNGVSIVPYPTRSNLIPDDHKWYLDNSYDWVINLKVPKALEDSGLPDLYDYIFGEDTSDSGLLLPITDFSLNEGDLTFVDVQLNYSNVQIPAAPYNYPSTITITLPVTVLPDSAYNSIIDWQSAYIDYFKLGDRFGMSSRDYRECYYSLIIQRITHGMDESDIFDYESHVCKAYRVIPKISIQAAGGSTKRSSTVNIEFTIVGED